MVDEYAGEVGARTVHERRGDGGIYAARAKKLGAVDYLVQGTIYPDVIESGLNHAAKIKSKDLKAFLGVHAFGVELHAVQFFVRALDSRGGAGLRGRRDGKDVGQFRHVIGMAHPALRRFFNAVEQFGFFTADT